MAEKIIKKEKDFKLDIKPNPIFQPFEYQKWKIIGQDHEFHKKVNVKKARSTWSDFILRFTKSWSGTMGILILVTIILMAFIVPFFTKDPELTNVNDRALSFQQKGYFFGTDHLGRDIWSRLWHGMRFSLMLSFFVTLVDVLIGVTLGLLMGKFEKFDKIMQTILKVIVNIPTLILMIIVIMIFNASFWTLTFSMVITGWTTMALQIRSQTKRVITAEWNTASKILATPQWKQLLSLYPHILPMLITQLISTIPGAILSEAGLSFLGLSVTDTATLGSLISEGTDVITIFPRYTLVPSFLLILTVTSVQFIGLATQKTLKRTR